LFWKFSCPHSVQSRIFWDSKDKVIFAMFDEICIIASQTIGKQNSSFFKFILSFQCVALHRYNQLITKLPAILIHVLCSVIARLETQVIISQCVITGLLLCQKRFNFLN
jgi:hypothetical protein